MQVSKPNARYVVCFILVLTTVLLYRQITTHEFVNYDDQIYVLDNSYVQSGLTLSGLRFAFSHVITFWQPLTWLSLMVDVEIGGVHPASFLSTNVILHTANAVLLFLVLNRMTGAIGFSGLVAGLFAWHPLNVEAVAWIASRNGLLSSFFYLLTLWGYVRYAEKRTIARYAYTLTFFLLGLMSKPNLVMLPAILLLLDLWPLRRFGRGDESKHSTDSKNVLYPKNTVIELLKEKIPFALVSAVFIGITFIAERNAGSVQPFGNYSVAFRSQKIAIGYFDYVLDMFWPFNLSVFYPYPKEFSTGAVLLAMAAFLIALLVIYKFRPGFFIVGLGWYFLALLPVIGFVSIGEYASADRYCYMPLIGLFIITSWLLHNSRRMAVFRYMRIGVFLWCAALVVISNAQIKHWQNSITLFEHSLKVTKNNYVALNNLAWAIATDRNRNQEEKEIAAIYARQACELTRYQDLGCVDTLVIACKATGRTLEASEALAKEIALATQSKDYDLLEKLYLTQSELKARPRGNSN